MVKELFDEAILRLLAANRKISDVPRPRQPYRLAIISGVIARRIDRLVVIARPKPPHGIVLLQTEAERIDHGMTTLAGLRARQLRHLLAHCHE